MRRQSPVRADPRAVAFRSLLVPLAVATLLLAGCGSEGTGAGTSAAPTPAFNQPAVSAVEGSFPLQDITPDAVGVSPDGSRVYLASMTHGLQAVDPATGKVTAAGDAGGDVPHSLYALPDGSALIVAVSRKILRVDPARLAVLSTIEPTMDADQQFATNAWVPPGQSTSLWLIESSRTCMTGGTSTITSISLPDGTPGKAYTLPGCGTAMTIAAGRAYIATANPTNPTSQAFPLQAVDLSTGKASAVYGSAGATGVVSDPSGTLVYAATPGGVSTFDAKTGTLQAEHVHGTWPVTVLLPAVTGTSVYVGDRPTDSEGQFTNIGTGVRSDLQLRGPGSPIGMAITPDGMNAWAVVGPTMFHLVPAAP